MEQSIPIEAKHLGQPLATYRMNYLVRLIQVLLWVSLTIFYVVEFDVFVGFEFFPFVFALVLFGLSLGKVVQFVKNIGLKVWVFRTGFAYLKLGQIFVIRWQDVETIWRKQYKYTINFIPIININELVIETAGGFRHKLFRNIKNFTDLTDHILQNVINLQAPKAIQKLENGEVLEFPPFKLSKTDIWYKKKTASWKELGNIQFWQGSIYFKKAGKENQTEPLLYSITGFH